MNSQIKGNEVKISIMINGIDKNGLVKKEKE